MFKRKIFTALFAASFFYTAINGQTLFSYGTKTVSKNEFLNAFNKNPDTTGKRSDKVREYLDMYVNFKLKIQAALDEKLNTTETFKAEGDNFKAQLTENYINEQANVNGLITEAFERSQKDILLAHVFVQSKPGSDTTEAYKQIQLAYTALQGGKDFGEVAATYSSDESVQKAKGNIGYITVFTLPYEIENTVYALTPGSYSKIYKSSIGYHIFKDISERSAVGKRKIQQILFATPEDFTEDERNNVKHLADSVYQQIANGASFERMQQLYSAPTTNNDPSNTLEIGISQYSSDFESQVFALQKPGEISKLFETAYGYNIIKLVEMLPVGKDANDVMNRAHLQEMVERDNRLATAKSALVEKWMTDTKFTPGVYNQKDLWAYTDSSLKKNKAIPSYKNITPQTTVFSFAKQKITVANWLSYYMEARQAFTPNVNKGFSSLMQDFIKTSCDKYYRSHIEDYYHPIAAQVKEFNDANLLFAVMDKHVWTKAAEDSVGLKNYYNQHKQQYNWQPGVGALVVSSASKEAIDSVGAQLKSSSNNWREIISKYNNTVMADSSRFENGQLPVKQDVPMQKGFISQPEQNDAGDTYTLVYIFDVYTQTAPRSFDDARGLVINDYQQVLEQKWVAELRKKYPVKLNEAVAKSL